MSEISEQAKARACPFCGECPEVSDIWLVHPENHCVLSGYEFGDAAKDGDEPSWVIAAWNTRAPFDALIEQLVSALEASEDILERYIHFLHHMPVSEIELHPYIPAVEGAFDNARAALSQARGEQP